jgi:hypothetical protein
MIFQKATPAILMVLLLFVSGLWMISSAVPTTAADTSLSCKNSSASGSGSGVGINCASAKEMAEAEAISQCLVDAGLKLCRYDKGCFSKGSGDVSVTSSCAQKVDGTWTGKAKATCEKFCGPKPEPKAPMEP